MKNFVLSSAKAFSATGFLFGFFKRPISIDKQNRLRVSSSFNARKPGAGSTRIRLVDHQEDGDRELSVRGCCEEYRGE